VEPKDLKKCFTKDMMTNEINTYFEVSDNENSIRIEIVELISPDAELDFDSNWLKSIISIKAGAFSGKFKANLMTTNFELFKFELDKLYDKLDGTATFATLESQVEMKIIGDGLGHLKADCMVMDNAGFGNKLEFKIAFDQTKIPKIINQLEKIMSKFPKSGNLD
jgi:hypothetical protein